MAKGQQRDPKREAFWRGVLAQFPKSGLSVRAFCHWQKVSEPAFYAWRRTIRERDAERSEARKSKPKRRAVRPAFVPVVVHEARPGDGNVSSLVRDDPTRNADGGLAVELRGGRVLRLPVTTTTERLAELIRAVESVPAEARP
jgi:transposase